ncbi:MAG: hypothetical protein VKJ06_04250, partial [Vampirovibrionales bacterium]|nr:hypothetical protein [Vampirovibrionales bacterium]
EITPYEYVYTVYLRVLISLLPCFLILLVAHQVLGAAANQWLAIMGVSVVAGLSAFTLWVGFSFPGVLRNITPYLAKKAIAAVEGR